MAVPQVPGAAELLRLKSDTYANVFGALLLGLKASSFIFHSPGQV